MLMTSSGHARRVKLVCTLGPATSTPQQVETLVRAGMDVARLNLSHGTHEAHRQLCTYVRNAERATGRVVAVLADLQGPRIRLGVFRDGSARLATGDDFIISAEPVIGSAERASTTYSQLACDVVAGDMILVDDGMVRLDVVTTDGREIRCRVVEGGLVADHKGVNLPGVHISAPAVTAKDAVDLRFALDVGADLVALSFVRSASDIDPLRAIMSDVGRSVPVLAKLEKPEAVAVLDEVVAAFDGLLVARGDLGVELPLQQVPVVQKRSIQAAREQSKPVVVATQMLESMIRHPRPTRAEVSDVANAVLDGADALMLSAETSIGSWPATALTTMADVIVATEDSLAADIPPLRAPATGREDAIAQAGVAIGSATTASALVAFTQTGTTARRLAARRPPMPLIAFTPDRAVQHQLALSWGVEAFIAPTVVTTDEMIRAVDEAMRGLPAVEPGDTVVVVAGTPPGKPGSTNSIRVHEVGKV
jgi:pyruvate kinase